MKLSLINEEKLSTAQIRDVDKLIRGLQNLKKGNFKETHQGWGRYHSIGRVISGMENQLSTARPLEIYEMSPVIARLIEKYPESIKMFQNHIKIIDPDTGKPNEFTFDELRYEKRKLEEAEEWGKTKLEMKITSMLRNRQGYRTLQNYINYLKKLGFGGTRGLDLTKLHLKMEHVTLTARSKIVMHAYLESTSFTINTNGEILKIEELIDTINEVILAAETLGIDIDSAWVSSRDGDVLYTLNKPTGETIDIDSEDIESVQDAYREIKKAIEEADFPKDE
jgi:hypothetical protein